MALNEGDIVASKYRIERLLGEGGMGAVYVATNTVLQKRVALKVMSERFASVPAAVERFSREAVAASHVSHPSIVQVFDAGEHEGAPWIAMEMLEGESLGERLERGPLSVPEVLEMADGVLSALAEVHEEGIVHRDLKPDNIFLARTRGGGWVPKVLDFGVAKDTSDGQLSKLTATGAVVGTAHYLSPEQAKGQADIDARADVYAMGVVLFEALSGHMPFEAETITQLIAKMFTEDPRRLDEVAPHVPRSIADVVTTCLEQDRAKRFQTARALLGAMRAAAGTLDGAPADPRSAGLAATDYAMPAVSRGTSQGAPDLASPSMRSYVHSQPGLSASDARSLPGAFPATAAGTPMPASRAAMSPTALMPSEVPLQAAPAKRGSRLGLVALFAGLFVIGAVGTIAGVWALMGDRDDDATVATNANEVVGPGSTQQATAETPTPQAPTAPTVAVADPAPPTPEPPVGAEPPPTREPPVGAEPPDAPEQQPEEQVEPEVATQPHEASTRRDARRRSRRADREPEHESETPPANEQQETPTPPEPAHPAPARGRPGLAPAQIMSAIQGRLPFLQERCYQRRLGRVPNLSGVVTISWTVRPDGRVENPQVVHNGTGDEWLARCTRNVVADTRFPASSSPTPARFPFQFHTR